jgi:ribosomal protein L44E|tara:strand:- start:6674 stop:6940 length:267 start_codon:yes stop_codon:yes gene_type:complete
VNRKQRRASAKMEKKQGNQDLADKMNIYTKLPESCMMCEAEFDKQNREMLSTWNVVVREQEKVVRLYCPDCWSAAQRVVENYEKGELK